MGKSNHFINEIHDECVWQGSGYTKDRRNQQLYYKQCLVNGKKISVGDHVLLNNSNMPGSEEDAYVAIIMEMFDNGETEDNYKAEVRWYYRISEIKPASLVKDRRNNREVFYNPQKSVAGLSTIIDLETVIGLCEVEQFPSHMEPDLCDDNTSIDGLPWFFVRVAYENRKFLPLKGTGCTAPMSRSASRCATPRSTKNSSRSHTPVRKITPKSTGKSVTVQMGTPTTELRVAVLNSVNALANTPRRRSLALSVKKTEDTVKPGSPLSVIPKRQAYKSEHFINSLLEDADDDLLSVTSEQSSEVSEKDVLPNRSSSARLATPQSNNENAASGTSLRRSARKSLTFHTETRSRSPDEKTNTTTPLRSSRKRKEGPSPEEDITNTSKRTRLRSPLEARTPTSHSTTSSPLRTRNREVSSQSQVKTPVSKRKQSQSSKKSASKSEGQKSVTRSRPMVEPKARKSLLSHQEFNADGTWKVITPDMEDKQRNRLRLRLNRPNYNATSPGHEGSEDSDYNPSDKENEGQEEEDEAFIPELHRTPRATSNCRKSTTTGTPRIPRTPKSRGGSKEVSTPRSKQIATPTIPGRISYTDKAGSVMEQARARLHVSALPDTLPCREEEFADIYQFVQGKIMDGTGGCMYISGVPGTGKTATVHQVIRFLKEEHEMGDLSYFKFIEVNGMKLTDPHQANVEILKQLNGQKATADHASNILDKRFNTADPRREPVVLLVDELDLLWTRKQTVMYNLFDWPTRPQARLIVLTIANTMDLPERIMMNRVASRLGLTRMTFQPYTHRQLQEIVMSRMKGVKAFDDDAIQLAARKVAALSGDARRALDICRRSTELAEVDCRKKKCDLMVKMSHVDAALQEMFSSPKIVAMRNGSLHERLFLRAIVSEFLRSGVEEAVFSKIYRQHITLCRFEGVTPPSASDMSAICAKLGSFRLILVENSRNDLNQRVRLNVSMDDVNYALKDTSTEFS